MNPYDTLGVPNNATPDEIKKRYKSLAQQYHPDKGGDPEKFKEINLAYTILIDDERRKDFDTTGNIYPRGSIKEEALNKLAMAIYHFINQINVDQEDLILVVKNDINREKTGLNQQISLVVTMIVKCEKVLKKIKRKKEGQNHLAGFVKVKIEQLEADIKTLNNQIQFCDVMLDILNDYRYGDELAELLTNSPTN